MRPVDLIVRFLIRKEKMEKEKFDKLNDNEKISTGTELSALSEAIENNEALKIKLIETRVLLEEEAVKVINAMSLAYDAKEESINSMRLWRKTIVSEASAINTAIDQLIKNTSKQRVLDLREYANTLERLNNIDPGMIISKLFRET